MARGRSACRQEVQQGEGYEPAMRTGAEPIILDYLRPRDWRQLARAAVLLDLSAGDYFDVRAHRAWQPRYHCVPSDRT